MNELALGNVIEFGGVTLVLICLMMIVWNAILHRQVERLRKQIEELTNGSNSASHALTSLKGQYEHLQVRNKALEGNNLHKLLAETSSSYAMVIASQMDDALPKIQDLEGLMASMSPDLRKAIDIPLSKEMQIGMAALTAQELEGLKKLRELAMRVILANRDETMKLLVLPRMVAGHSLTIEEMFQKFEASLERCGINAVMREEIIRQFAVDIQRYRTTANPDGVQPDLETLKRLNTAYNIAPSPEPKSKKEAPVEELDPGVVRLNTPGTPPRYEYVNSHNNQKGA